MCVIVWFPPLPITSTKTYDRLELCAILLYRTSVSFQQGCGAKVQDFVENRLGVLAGVAIAFGFMQVITVVVVVLLKNIDRLFVSCR